MMRINIFGGPCVGKTTLASHLYAKLKARGINIEHVPDYVKMWAYEGKKIMPFDQLYFLAKQMRSEMDLLNNGVDVVLTDCPLLLTVCYATKYGFPDVKALESICAEFDCEHPSINIYLRRDGQDYTQIGRYENEMEAVIMDDIIYGMLQKNQVEFKVFDHYDYDAILDYILAELGL